MCNRNVAVKFQLLALYDSQPRRAPLCYFFPRTDYGFPAFNLAFNNKSSADANVPKSLRIRLKCLEWRYTGTCRYTLSFSFVFCLTEATTCNPCCFYTHCIYCLTQLSTFQLHSRNTCWPILQRLLAFCPKRACCLIRRRSQEPTWSVSTADWQHLSALCKRTRGVRHFPDV